ncbi:uncharacterized protein GIQ15_04332 [Arthroderma uncinatum]|uniref:uncharacterized protein n=1 Tax=Arthroderma uncinatum TaxID=74035 RepID=UPI00144A5BA5|nr:uncharacterized protein GIQ15_04332 [Arthroderma uncinatum]KAF3481573.1 hypothetical protein GIQ15_04332 [Arthroderma uncinatum]
MQFLSLDRHDDGQDSPLSPTSGPPTVVDDAPYIRTLLIDQPFTLWHNPSDPRDMVVANRASFRKFLERGGFGLTVDAPLLAVVLEKYQKSWSSAYLPLRFISLRRAMLLENEREIGGDMKRYYGQCLIAGCLRRRRKIQLDDKYQHSRDGTFYDCRLERARFPREGKMKYTLDFTVFLHTSNMKRDMRLRVWVLEKDICGLENLGIHLHTSTLKPLEGRHCACLDSR